MTSLRKRHSQVKRLISETLRGLELELPLRFALDYSRSYLQTLCDIVRPAIRDRSCGIVLIKWDPSDASSLDVEPLMRNFCAALGRSLGGILPETCNTDGCEMEARESVDIELNAQMESSNRMRHFSDSRLAWPLHTDRTLHRDVGDYLLVCKLLERGGSGGRIRLLHLDDWFDHAMYRNDPLGELPVRWKGDSSMAPVWMQSQVHRRRGVSAPIFETHPEFGTTIRWTDARFRMPASLEHHRFLERVSESLQQKSSSMPSFDMPVGDIYIVNNRTVLHGREGFEPSPEFKRRLLRICGNLRE